MKSKFTKQEKKDMWKSATDFLSRHPFSFQQLLTIWFWENFNTEKSDLFYENIKDGYFMLFAYEEVVKHYKKNKQ